MHDAEALRFSERHFQAADGNIGRLRHMLLQHRLVIHFVDMVAGKDDDMPWRIALDDVDILINGISRTGVPLLFGDPLAGRENVEALIAFGPEEIPPALQMPNEAMRFVLGRNTDAAN